MKDFFVGIDENWKQDFGIGLGIGLLFIFANSISPIFKLGLPDVPLAFEQAAKSIVTIVIAGTVEEFFFRGLLLSIFKSILKNFHYAIIIQAVLFSLYHAKAYGLGLQTAFIGALIFGVIAGYLVILTKSQVANVSAHMLINAYLLYSGMITIGGIV